MAMFKPGGMSEEKPEAEPSGFGSDEDMAASTSKSAAKDLLSALKGGDVDAIDSALRAHYEACQGE
jgi:hypothetical protein